MELKIAIECLAHTAHQGTGSSAGAATVLLFGWNAAHPMRGLMSLDENNRSAALIVIEAAFTHRLKGGQVIEAVVGYEAIRSLIGDYGNRGSVWES